MHGVEEPDACKERREFLYIFVAPLSLWGFLPENLQISHIMAEF